ncbi:MAG: hypothetical protein FWE21_02245 [Defluviitaleaceae bacterium]|nr:hypothetical protein [Defluviitaleaceae bacterium]
MKKVFLAAIVSICALFAFAACGSDDPAPVEARAIFELDRLYFDGEETEIAGTPYQNSRITFIGEEAGGNAIIRIGQTDVQASINPSRNHPSFADGYWHHHLYSGATAPGSPRINFMNALPSLNIDDNGADDNTQSAYQRGNLHYIVETGEFRLRFTVGGIVHDMFFVQTGGSN